MCAMVPLNLTILLSFYVHKVPNKNKGRKRQHRCMLAMTMMLTTIGYMEYSSSETALQLQLIGESWQNVVMIIDSYDVYMMLTTTSENVLMCKIKHMHLYNTE